MHISTERFGYFPVLNVVAQHGPCLNNKLLALDCRICLYF